MNALRAFLVLSPEQKHLLRVKVVEGRYDPRALVALLAPLARFDAVADRLRRLLLTVGIIAIAAGVVTFFTAGTLPALVLGVAGTAWVVAAIRLRRIDLSNNLRAAVPFLAVLREEMAPGATVDVRIDLSAPMSAGNRTRTSEPYARDGYRKIVDRIYDHPWFEGRVELVDRVAARGVRHGFRRCQPACCALKGCPTSMQAAPGTQRRPPVPAPSPFRASPSPDFL